MLVEEKIIGTDQELHTLLPVAKENIVESDRVEHAI